MEIYCEEERDKPPRYLGEVAPGITLEGYCGFLSQLTVYDKESGEIQQKFEIFSDGMHFIVIPQPKPVATQMLLKNYTDLYRESYKKTTGKEWINSAIRDRISTFIWEIPALGKEEIVNSVAVYFEDTEKKIQPFTITAVAFSPRLLTIDNFLSRTEAESLTETYSNRLIPSKDYELFELTTTKTNFLGSKTLWATFRDSPLLERVCTRACDLLKLPRSFTLCQSSENIQFSLIDGEIEQNITVREFIDIKHNPNNASIIKGNNRFGFKIYKVENQMNFPKAEPAETECSLRLKVGNAVVMYNMLRDGNLEENAIYNIPATKGEVLLMAMRIWNKTLL